MRRLTIEVEEARYEFFKELVESFKFARIIATDGEVEKEFRKGLKRWRK